MSIYGNIFMADFSYLVFILRKYFIFFKITIVFFLHILYLVFEITGIFTGTDTTHWSKAELAGILKHKKCDN